MPFQRAQLAIRLEQSAISNATNLSPALTSYLLSITKSSSGESALNILLALKGSGLAALEDGLVTRFHPRQIPSPSWLRARPSLRAW